MIGREYCLCRDISGAKIRMDERRADAAEAAEERAWVERTAPNGSRRRARADSARAVGRCSLIPGLSRRRQRRGSAASVFRRYCRAQRRGGGEAGPSRQAQHRFRWDRRRDGPDARARALEGGARRRDGGIRDRGALAPQGTRPRLDADAARHRLRQRKRAAAHLWRRARRKREHAANVRRTWLPRPRHGIGHEARRARSAQSGPVSSLTATTESVPAPLRPEAARRRRPCRLEAYHANQIKLRHERKEREAKEAREVSKRSVGIHALF